MPKKKKIVQDKSGAPLESSASSNVKVAKASRTRRATTSRKSREPSAGKNAVTAKVSNPLKAAGIPDPSDEAVRLRAYFISERRRRFALPGDAESDWLEAKRQLVSEADHR